MSAPGKAARLPQLIRLQAGFVRDLAAFVGLNCRCVCRLPMLATQ